MSRETCNNVATNLQRAIEWLGVRYEQIPKHLPEDEAFFIAVNAMREQQEREKGCEYCNDGEAMAYGQDSLRRAGYIYLDGNLLTADLYSDSMAVSVCYCPMCGKRLEVEQK